MYLKHFNLGQKPFENTTNPRFFWLNETFAEAQAAFEYGLKENKGFILLTGSSGSGKTTLIRAFLETLEPQICVAVIPDADMEPVDFFNYLAMELGFQRTFANKGEFLIFFKRYLRERIRPAGGKVLIIIDEAQRSANRLLTDIRLFDSLGTDNETDVTVVLSGQPRMLELLADPENAGLRSRVALDIRIEPFIEADTEKYIRHRMNKAGAKDSIFTADAVQAIFQFAGGNPLQINNLCDRALLTAYINGVEEVDTDTISECAGELGISLDTNPRIGDDAVQSLEPDEDSIEPQKAESPNTRAIRLLVLALIGVALTIILQMSFFHPSGFDQSADQDQALSTFESYQQHFETTDEPEASTF